MVDSVQVFPPGFRVVDSNGAPVNGAKIKFHLPGPGAVKPVFSDAALSVNLGDIVYTRADGFPVTTQGGNTTTLIYTGSAAYYVEITDANDVPLFPAKDNVKGAVDTSTFLTSGSVSTLSLAVVSKTANYTALLADKGKVINGNPAGGSFTITLDAAATLTNGWSLFIRNGAATNQVGISAAQNISTPMGLTAAFALRPGEAVLLTCDGAAFQADLYMPALFGTAGIIDITDRVAAAPGSPTAGARYIATAIFVAGAVTTAVGDIIEANGQGNWFKFTPPSNCGWVAFVRSEARYYSYQSTAWVLGLDPAASDTVAGLIELAVQSEMETATDVVRAVTPGRQKFHPGHPKFWAFVTVAAGVPTLQTSFNVASITDAGVGLLTVTLTVSFSSVNWAPFVATEYAAAEASGQVSNIVNASIAAGSVQANSKGTGASSNAALSDPASWSVMGFGDQ